ncbi:hypothetical protein D7X74_29065 [Corallococcus sp. CA047B]|nr:hypothetical protein D7X74_29065 [Corallococcus sp. CA047B]
MTSLESKMAALERRVFGKKAEKLPPVAQELRGEARSPEKETAQAEAALANRRERAARKAAEAPTREVWHAVPPKARQCPACGSGDLKPLGEGRKAVTYEYVPAFFERFGLRHLPLRAVVAEATREEELERALYVVANPLHLHGLTRAFFLRERLLALPEEDTGREAQLFRLAVQDTKLIPPLEALEQKLARRMLDHAQAANALTQELDRLIVAFWGYPPERLDDKVTVAELVATGLELQYFDS